MQNSVVFYFLGKFGPKLKKCAKGNLIPKLIRISTIQWPSANLDKTSVRLSDAAPSHYILRKPFFVAKPFKKGLNRRY